MAGFDRGRWLAAVAVSAWLVTTVSAQQSCPPGLAGTFPHGHVGSSDPQGPTQDRSVSGMAELVRLPPVGSVPVGQTPSVMHNLISPSQPGILPNANAGSGVDGTWQEDGQFLILNLNGQQLRLAKKVSPHAHAMVSQNVPSVGALLGGGEVRGRLSHRGQPLVGCEVTMIPLSKSWLGYRNDRSAKPIFATTNSEGAYSFAQVPAGPYKLKWRPAGEASWIRRAETRPDVNVRTNELATIKEIRVALRTIN